MTDEQKKKVKDFINAVRDLHNASGLKEKMSYYFLLFDNESFWHDGFGCPACTANLLLKKIIPELANEPHTNEEIDAALKENKLFNAKVANAYKN